MELATYQLLYKILSTIKTILIWFFIGLFIYNSYHLYINNAALLIDYLKFSSKSSNTNGVLIYVFKELNLLKYLAIMMIILFICHYLYSIFPVPKKWIFQWDKNKEIDTILGRFLSYHYRYNKWLNTRELYYLYNVAQFEKSMLIYHINKTQLHNFIKKYDDNFSHDIE